MIAVVSYNEKNSEETINESKELVVFTKLLYLQKRNIYDSTGMYRYCAAHKKKRDQRPPAFAWRAKIILSIENTVCWSWRRRGMRSN